MPEQQPSDPRATPPMPSSKEILGSYWAWPEQDVLRALGAAPAGLSTDEARARLRRAGALAPHHRRTQLGLLLRQFSNPITLILVFATVVSAVLAKTTDAAIILAIVLLSGFLSFWQEYGASRAVEDLLATVQVTVEALRNGHRAFIPARDVFPGDVVLLHTGDLVPGDCLLLDTRELQVDQAPLTGASFPVEKLPGPVAAGTPLVERANCLFQGTYVVRGTATAVAHTGGETEFGRIARELERRPPITRFERRLTEFGRLLLRVIVVLVVLIFVANVLLRRPLIDSLLFSVALAVA